MKLSQRVKEVPFSAIRKLTPLSDAAEKAGKKVYHLNIGAPDTKTPEEFLDAIRAIELQTIDYAPSKGIKELREATCGYYARRGKSYDPEKDIVITSGASEALRFAVETICDIGDNIVTTNPFYSNYQTMAKEIGIKMKTFDTIIDQGYRLPSKDVIQEAIDERSRAILISNPSNPTGAVYSHEEIQRIVDVALENDLFIIADEVYSEFIFDGAEFASFTGVEGIDDRLILMDSISKRFGACGARIGALICKNPEIMDGVVRLATSRLAVSTVDQIGAAALYDVSDAYFRNVNDEYNRRRHAIYEELTKLDGVKVTMPEGAFYVMPELPVKDTDDFAAWLLNDFEDEGETVMVAPAFGFYQNNDAGKTQVRLAYVINEKDIRRAIQILGKALVEYKKDHE
ncbi:pyridoxal phosphate-dependent aminotransferase [Peptoniphilus equinus]|uniref:Aminotransferase n=1 Tax=Peptoniphilus equinus TaxID=3016343 RepID=A0ABY7QT99_9FIRM|nr:pyridoxal phosphate-dependent aminotransferase [Peptoniphilus equinus]WBW50014.1 pyridoxal phosphate-dependent aminotransferase [Peptoniphilus equinus]